MKVESKGLRRKQWVCRTSYPTWCCISTPAQKLLLLLGLTAAALPQRMGGLSLVAWQRQAMHSDPRQVPTPACAHARDLMQALLLQAEGNLGALWYCSEDSQHFVHCIANLRARSTYGACILAYACWSTLGSKSPTKASNATGCDYMSMSHTSADLDESAAGTSYCGAFVAAPEQYCARTVNLQFFSEVNR